MKTLQVARTGHRAAQQSNPTPGRDVAHTGNEAAKLKLYAEISLLKGIVPKRAWGVTCFDLYSQGDAEWCQRQAARRALVKIREKESKVQAKIVELNKPTSAEGAGRR